MAKIEYIYNDNPRLQLKMVILVVDRQCHYKVHEGTTKSHRNGFQQGGGGEGLCL